MSQRNDELKAQEDSVKSRLKHKKSGRPSKFDNTKTVRELLHHAAEIGLSLDHACELTGLHYATIERYLGRYFGKTYAKFRKQKMGLTANMLIQRAMNHALLADERELKPAILIFLLKNYCGMTDKPVEEVTDAKNIINLQYNLETPPGAVRDVSKREEGE